MRVKRGRQALAADAQRVLTRAREAGPPKGSKGSGKPEEPRGNR